VTPSVGCRCALGMLVALGVLLAAGGCGGHGPKPWDGSPGLLVGMEEERNGIVLPWSIEVDGSGTCRCELPWTFSNDYAGLFRTQLPAAFMRRLSAAVERAAQAGLEPYYPADPWVPRCRFRLAGPEGVISVDVPDRANTEPEPLRPLYDLRGVMARGLLAEARDLAEQHPWKAVAPSIALDQPIHGVGDPITSVLRLRSVGTDPIAVPTLQVEHLVRCYGFVVVSREGAEVRRRNLRFGSSYTGRPAAVLTPEATADLQNLVVLAPGEHYDLPLPAVRARRAGSHLLRAHTVIRRCFDGRAIEQALRVPLVESGLSAEAPVQVTE
jgi:hypothetical protein